MKHRKLFPTNQTVDCPDFCDPSCPYNCYPYEDIYISPPPPPPPLPPLSDAGETQHLRPYVIIIISLLASFFLLVSYYAIIVKYCSRWNRFRPPPTESDGPDEEFLDENRGPTIDHPIWYIATVGLQPSIINSITVFRYKKGDDPVIEGTECSVCLSEFQDDETLRLLPKCNHAFHIHCIDTWLRSHTNCPLCRAGIVSNAVSNTHLDSNEHHSRTLISPNEDTEMENSEAERGNNLVSNVEICENRARTEDEVELQEIEDDSKEVLNSNGVNDIRVFVDSDNNEMMMDDETQTVRRSISMNSVNQREDFQNLDLGIVWKREDDNSRMNRFMGSSSISQSLHKSPVSMKRSFSHGGRLSFLPRHSRNTSSILPL